MTKGGRNSRLNNAALKLGGYVAAGHLERKVVERALFEAAVACGHVADDGENAAINTINSGLNAGIAKGPKSAPEREPKTERAAHTKSGNGSGNTQEPAAVAPRSDVQDDGGPFVVTESGVFYRYSKDGEDMLDKICSRLDVIAVTHDESGNGWGRVMQFQDLAGCLHEWAMPMSLAAGDGSEIRAELLDQGLRIEPFKHAGQRVIQYITSSTPADTWLSVTRPGWHGDYFIMPGETFGNGGQRAVLQRERSFKHNFRVQGTLDEWQANVSRLCVGNAYLAFGVSAAFAAPLLNLTHEQGGGFHFRGGSSCGKSTTLEVAGSVMGGGGQNGYLTSWRATDNGLEGVGESHCDALLCIDEIGQADPRTLYMLANGQGKIRASKSGSARAPAEWRLLFLSNGEESLASRMNEAGSKTHAGMEVRLADIPVCGKWGVIDALHEFSESRDLVNHLKKAARRFYGSPIREYLRRLVLLDREAVAKEVASYQVEFQGKYVPPGSGEQVERVAKRFALAAAGGELATDMGITGWETGEAMKAAAGCFKAWLGARGTIGNTEDVSGSSAFPVHMAAPAPMGVPLLYEGR
jgi:putative DNA primase/helicase